MADKNAESVIRSAATNEAGLPHWELIKDGSFRINSGFAPGSKAPAVRLGPFSKLLAAIRKLFARPLNRNPGQGSR